MHYEHILNMNRTGKLNNTTKKTNNSDVGDDYDDDFDVEIYERKK